MTHHHPHYDHLQQHSPFTLCDHHSHPCFDLCHHHPLNHCQHTELLIITLIMIIFANITPFKVILIVIIAIIILIFLFLILMSLKQDQDMNRSRYIAISIGFPVALYLAMANPCREHIWQFILETFASA